MEVDGRWFSFPVGWFLGFTLDLGGVAKIPPTHHHHQPKNTTGSPSFSASWELWNHSPKTRGEPVDVNSPVVETREKGKLIFFMKEVYIIVLNHNRSNHNTVYCSTGHVSPMYFLPPWSVFCLMGTYVYRSVRMVGWLADMFFSSRILGFSQWWYGDT